MDSRENILQTFESFRNWLSIDNFVSMPDVEQCLIFKLNYAHKNILNNNRSPDVMQSIQAVLDILWEDLNTGHWSQVSEKKRKLYSLASLFKVIRLVQEIIFVGGCPYHQIRKAIKAADMGLLMGCGYHEQLSEAAKMLSGILSDDESFTKPVNSSSLSAQIKDKFNDWNFSGIVGEIISAEKCPSLENFYKKNFVPKIPVKLQDCVAHWPALDKWKNVDYLLHLAGPRMVPIELGSAYTQEDWGMKLIPFEDFINKFICQKSGKIGYLAQHQLFDQIPDLKKDIFVPDYCCLSESDADDDQCDVDINAWFGPSGTVSPLHFDPKHNLLTQVVGRKRIILYSPNDSDNLYPHESSMLHNTSQVDPESPNYVRYPKFKSSVAYECHLYPGEMLYIPPKWWHHVRSLDTSFSVSFWWK